MRVVPILLASCAIVASAHADVVAQNEQTLEPNNPVAGDEFGASAAIEGDLTVFGAPGRDVAGPEGSGAAYVYLRSGNVSSQEAELLSSAPILQGDFGRAVDLSLDRVVVGAPGERSNGLPTGVAYVFVRSGTTWSQEARLVPSGGSPGDGFGSAVAIFGDRILVGAPGDDQDGTDAGAVYVFGLVGSSWQQTTELRGNSGAPARDEFGAAVDLVGNTAAIGAPRSDAGGLLYIFESAGAGFAQTRRLQINEGPNPALGATVRIADDMIFAAAPENTGGAGVFFTTRTGTSWSALSKIVANASASDRLGDSIALEGDRLFVGAPLLRSGTGGVFVFDRIDGVFCAQGGLPSSGDAQGRFGTSLASSQGRVVVGAPLSGTGGEAFASRPVQDRALTLEAEILKPSLTLSQFANEIGLDGDTLVVAYPNPLIDAVYVFERQVGAWSQTTELNGTPGERNFGTDVDVDGSTIVVGATPGLIVPSVYVFVGGGGAWNEQASFSAADTVVGDGFGSSVSIDGDRLAAGASGSGANGAAYVFERTGTSWSESVRLPGASPAEGFGQSVALDADTLLVGAPAADAFATDAGAARVFVRSGTAWLPQAELLPSVAGTQRFGSQVALAGDTAAVVASGTEGAVYLFERSGTTWTESFRIGGLTTFQASPGAASVTIDLDAERLVIGELIVSGRPLVVRRIAGEWGVERELAGCAPTVSLGRAVAVDGANVFVGEEDEIYRYELDEIFASFCDATDGALASCPCGNPGSPSSGCDLPQAMGGVELMVLAQERGTQNRATMVAEGYPTQSTPASVILRSRTLDGAGPVVFGDGLRCVGPEVVRVEASIGVGGAATYQLGHGADTGEYFYQAWFRSQPASFCTPSAFNLSNGRVLVW